MRAMAVRGGPLAHLLDLCICSRRAAEGRDVHGGSRSTRRRLALVRPRRRVAPRVGGRGSSRIGCRSAAGAPCVCSLFSQGQHAMIASVDRTGGRRRRDLLQRSAELESHVESTKNPNAQPLHISPFSSTLQFNHSSPIHYAHSQSFNVSRTHCSLAECSIGPGTPITFANMNSRPTSRATSQPSSHESVSDPVGMTLAKP